MSQPSDLELAHRHSIPHRAEVESSDSCGCFYCSATFPPSAIRDWVDWPPDAPDDRQLDLGQTALCPRYGINSVLGSASGFPITAEFLSRMHARWFEATAGGSCEG